MADQKKSRSGWDNIQSVILLLTPVLIAVLGYFFNKSLSDIQGQIANVSAMKPFMEMIASKDITKSKMGAYAIYMLKKEDDPEIAAQMILAPGKQHLLDVLVDIGTRDPAIKEVVNNVLANLDMTEVDSTTQLSDIQKNALEIINKIDKQQTSKSAASQLNELLYLGNFQREPKSALDYRTSS